MKIGFLSICTMMFMLYGTDCRADRNIENFEVSEALQEVKNESFKPVFAKNRRNSLKNEKRKNVKKSKQEASNSEETDEEFYDAVDPEYNAWLEKKNREEKNSAESKANKNSWERDKRSYADVAKGVKKQDNETKQEISNESVGAETENNKIGSPDSWVKDQKNYKLKNKWKNKSYGRWESESDDKKTDFSDNWLKDQKNYKLKNKWKNKSYGRWESEPTENSEKVEQSQSDVKEVAVFENQDKTENREVTKKKQDNTSQPKENFSKKKAFEARRAKQSAKEQDEFSKKWKSANKSSNYQRK